MLWKVPPEIPSEGRGRPGGALIVTSTSTAARPSSKRSRAASAASRTDRSGGSASNPHTCTTFTPAAAAGAIELVDHPPHERHLTRQIHIVGAAERRMPRSPAGHTGCRDQRGSAPRERATAIAASESGSATSATIVSGALTPASPSVRLHLLGVARRGRPAQAGLGCAFGQVARDRRPVTPVAPKTTTSRSRSLTPPDDTGTPVCSRRPSSLPGGSMSSLTCLVISPVGDAGSDTRRRADQVFKHIIEPVVSGLGFAAKRADQMRLPGDHHRPRCWPPSRTRTWWWPT